MTDTADGFDKVTLDHLRTLPDGSLSRAEVNLLIDYIERLERLITEWGKVTVSDSSVKPAEQDGEYLHEAHQIIAEALACGGPVEDELDAATAVLDALAAEGWHLLTAEDAEKVLGAYVLQEVRAGRVRTTCSTCGRTRDDPEAGFCSNPYHSLDGWGDYRHEQGRR